MSELVSPQVKSQYERQHMARLDETIATIEAAKRSPNHNDDLLKALRLERDRIASFISLARREARP